MEEFSVYKYRPHSQVVFNFENLDVPIEIM